MTEKIPETQVSTQHAFIYVFISEIIVPSRDEKLVLEAEQLGTMILGTMPKINLVDTTPVEKTSNYHQESKRG